MLKRAARIWSERPRQIKMETMPLLTKIGPGLVSGLILLIVIIQVPPPESLSQASPFQLVIFFLPFIALLTFLANLLFSYLPRSLVFSLGLSALLILQSLGLLNLPILVIIFLAAFLLLRVIKKPHSVYIPKILQTSQLKKQR